MDTIALSLSVPVTAETDVLVVGGGPAGIAAALATAEGIAPRHVPVPWVQETLLRHGAYLDTPPPATSR